MKDEDTPERGPSAEAQYADAEAWAVDAEGGSVSPRWSERFDGIARLYGRRAAARIARARIAVIGVGGVGSWTVEALARSGVGTLGLVDLDDVCVSNVNRQIHALSAHVGAPKVEVLAERIRGIHPGCQVEVICDFVTADTVDEVLGRGWDVVVDAIDDVANKCLLIARARELGQALVVAGAAGGRRDPCALRVDDLAFSTSDGMLRDVRRTLRRRYAFPEQGAWGIPSVFSRERPLYPTPEGELCERPGPGLGLQLDCANSFGAATFVTGAFGFSAAAEAIRQVLAAPAAPRDDDGGATTPGS